MRLSAADHALLGPINALLRNQPDAEVVPLADRSYQLYGDEKRLKNIERHHSSPKASSTSPHTYVPDPRPPLWRCSNSDPHPGCSSWRTPPPA